MANVQVANTMQYRSVPATILPETCGNNGRQEQQWYNLALLPSTNSNTPFKAYMPVSMAANLGATQTQPPPSNQCAAPPQNASQAPPVNAKKKAKPEECVTKIIVSNFEGPLTVTCTDVTPKCPPNPIPPPVSQFAPYQPPMPCPEPLPTVRPYYRYPSEPQDSYRPRRSQSKSKSYKKRSKTPKKAKPHGREHAEPPSKEGRGRKKSRSPSPSRSESPRLKPTRSTGPALLSTSTGPLSSVTPNHLPPPPTVEQLQSAVLRPVQPRPKPYSIVTAQTLPLPVEPEKTATRERSKSPERRMYPCHCVPMIYCMPSCPYPYHQPRSSRADRRMQRLLDICEGKSPIKVQVIKELERSYSLPKPRGQRDGRPCQHPSDQTRRSVLPNLTIDHARETTPLKTTIKTSPPPQQPLHSQGLFGMRKGTAVSRHSHDEELSTWARRNVADGEGGGDFRGGRPPSRRGPPLFQPPLLRGSSTLSNPNRGNPAPKLGPKPTIQWPPRIRPGGSDKPTSPPIIEFGGAKRISESSDDRGGGGASQVEGSYEVIWDYFSENGGETDEEGEDREVEEARSSQMVGPSSGSYYNISSKSPPKVILKVKHEEPM